MRRGYFNRTRLRVNESSEGELLIQKVDRIVNNGEPITDGVSLIYTERKDGVMPEYDIRTDRTEIALKAMDSVAASRIARRDAQIKAREIKPSIKKDAEGKSTDSTGGEPTSEK